MHSYARKVGCLSLARELQLLGVNLNKNAVSNIELGKRSISDIELFAIIAALHVSADDIFRYGNKKLANL